MIPNLDFIKTLVNGLWFKIRRLVTSVNGQTGDVKLTAKEVGALPDTFSETDPTVPNWAKQATKPAYTAKEVGALPDTTKIPSKTSELTNDSGFLADYTETDPTVPDWAKQPEKPSYTVAEIEGAAPIANPKFTGSVSMGRRFGTTVGDKSVAFGQNVEASGDLSHAEGLQPHALGHASHAEGYESTASGDYSHAEGAFTTASQLYAHAEGLGTVASDVCSHAEGFYTVASGESSHVEGEYTIAAGYAQHVQGSYNVENTNGKYAHIVGNGRRTQNDAGETVVARSNAHTLDWEGNAWFAGDVYVGSTSGTNRDEGSKKLATEEYVNSVAMGGVEVPVYGVATPEADGLMSKEDKAKLDGLDGSSSGSGVGAAGTGENAEVFNGGAAENASGDYAHAEGFDTTASGDYAHAEGFDTTASGDYAHAEGRETTASGRASHAEGRECVASGLFSHAEGQITTASDTGAHAEGNGTVAASAFQHVQGQYNIEDAELQYLHIVGNGDSESSRANAHTLDWEGNAWFAGSVEGTALILTSPSGKRFRITVNDNGALSVAALTT